MRLSERGKQDGDVLERHKIESSSSLKTLTEKWKGLSRVDCL